MSLRNLNPISVNPAHVHGMPRRFSRTIPAQYHILLITNEMIPGRGIGTSLENVDCKVRYVSRAADAVTMTREQDLDLIIVDMRPDLLGYEVVRQLRLSHVNVPVLFVSARSTPDAVERAWSAGADDLVVMPLDETALRGRLRMLAHHGGAARLAREVHFGSLRIDPAHRCVRVNSRPLDLSRSEYRVLELLVSRDGAAVPSSAITAAVRDCSDAPATRGLTRVISGLRHKLMKAGAGDIVRTVKGLGFALGYGGPGSAGSRCVIEGEYHDAEVSQCAA